MASLIPFNALKSNSKTVQPPVQWSLSDGMQQTAAHIRSLEMRLNQSQLEKHQEALRLELQAFEQAEAKEKLAAELKKSEQETQELRSQLEQREKEVAGLSEKQNQNAAQIQLLLKEIEAMTKTLELGKEKEFLLSNRLEAANQKIDQLTSSMQQFENLQKETLRMLRQQQELQSSNSGSGLSAIFQAVWGMVERGLQGFDPSLYEKI